MSHREPQGIGRDAGCDPDDADDDGIDRDVLRSWPFFFDWPVSQRAFAHSCIYMGYAVTIYPCDQHPWPFDCPDNTFIYHEVFDEYGVIRHNPENHYARLRFCPFCSTALPPSRRQDWERELTGMGFRLFGDAMGEALEATKSYTQAWRAIGVPERYLTAAWRLPPGA